MFGKWKYPLVVLALLALLFSGCERMNVPSGGEDTQMPENSSGNTIEPSSGPSGTPAASQEVQTPEPAINSELVPFAQVQGQSVLYGYMDSAGNVVIAPRLSSAEPFYESGVAIVSEKDGYMGLIDKTGNYIAEPKPGYMYYSGGVFEQYSDEESMTYGYDSKGNQLFKVSGYISSFSEGMAVLYGDNDQQYIDTAGKTVLTVPYYNLGNFVDGVARVAKDYSSPALYIDKNGNDLTDTLSSGIRIVQDGEGGLFSYEGKDGNPINGDKYCEAEPFRGGLAIVNASGDFSVPSYGIINEKGEYMLKPIYTGILRMRNGSFAVGPAVLSDSYVPSSFFENTTKAVFSKDLKNNTDWIFISLEDYDKDYVCVNDGKQVYYIDSNLARGKDFPEFKGNGLMAADGDKFRGTLDDCITVADRKGNILLQDKKLTMFSDGSYTETVTEYPDIHTTITYPVIKGMKDQAMQDSLNRTVRDNAMSSMETPTEDTGDPYSFPVTIVNSSLKITKDLMQVEKGVDMYWMGAAHGGYFREVLFVNTKNGNTYTLKDLFKSPDEAANYISGEITAKMKDDPNDGMYLVDSVTPDQINFFYLDDDGINVYFAEYEIAAYAAGMPEFHFSFTDLSDYINYDGEFWKSFN